MQVRSNNRTRTAKLGNNWIGISRLPAPTEQERCDCQRLDDRGIDEEIGCSTRRFMAGLRRQVPNQPKRRWRKRVGTLGNGNNEGNDPRHIVLDEFDLGNEWWQERPVAEPETKQDNTQKQQRNVRASGNKEGK